MEAPVDGPDPVRSISSLCITRNLHIRCTNSKYPEGLSALSGEWSARLVQNPSAPTLLTSEGISIHPIKTSRVQTIESSRARSLLTRPAHVRRKLRQHLRRPSWISSRGSDSGGVFFSGFAQLGNRWLAYPRPQDARCVLTASPRLSSSIRKVSWPYGESSSQ